MQTPQENASGYDDNSPINYADKLQGNYLLVHGTGDDNVHVQNSRRMINALVAANKPFDVAMYTLIELTELEKVKTLAFICIIK